MPNPKISWRLSFSNVFSRFRVSGLRGTKWPGPLSAGSPVCRNAENIPSLISICFLRFHDSGFQEFGYNDPGTFGLPVCEMSKFPFGQFNGPDLLVI
jgi:hypothetical protein